MVAKSKKRNLKDGVVGLKNNSLYCYMNACLQCLIPIETLRDYYMTCGFQKFYSTKTASNSNDYCRMFGEFYVEVFKYEKEDQTYFNPSGLKNIIRRHFYPMMQHDSHEFLMHILS